MLCKATYFFMWYMHCMLIKNPRSVPAGIYDIISLDFAETEAAHCLVGFCRCTLGDKTRCGATLKEHV